MKKGIIYINPERGPKPNVAFMLNLTCDQGSAK